MHPWQDNRENDSTSMADHDPTEPPAKKTKTQSETGFEAWASWKYPPEFWARLSEISLTPRAIEEHNRRLRLQHHPSPPLPGQKEPVEHLVHRLPARHLARFSRHGGPDLSGLRGYPVTMRQLSVAMSASQSSQSRATMCVDPTSTFPTSVTTKTTKTKKTTPYDRNFDLHLTDHSIHPVYSSREPNLVEIMTAIAVPRPSLSPSKFFNSTFKAFQESNARAKDEDDVLANVLPTILGPRQTAHATARNTVFTNLEPLTDGTIPPPRPDIYYGAHPEELSRSPWAPNFFVEVKGPDGSAAVATRQVRYDGAVGSRTMHSLQNYREEEPKYDSQAYTYSSTYHAGTGTLQLYAHHVTTPTEKGGRSEYHLTQMRTFGMTDTRETFIQGVTALRNTRDLAKRHRDRFIQAASARASQSRTTVSQDIVETLEGDPNTYQSEWRDGDGELQQSTTDASGNGFEDGGKAIANPQPLYIKGDSEETNQSSEALEDDPSLGLMTNFASSFSSAKRPRKSVSLPSQSRKRFRKRHITESSP
ncbi:uncharacterized protein F4822DRAFT_429231 [Hypoxylon trugodes]|uniref:uncharacterized protein n=1 Tax=Hypoxylon trugodes TaxID=326681 RepID=UPI00219D5AE2|nr:uncharacterized protein F4822DRAFT_429231 [Hypoxylon trugodes]KAI1388614.1 hypothetical protein F4822DRAFT_429231 [Hypoxylon trugodes]